MQACITISAGCRIALKIWKEKSAGPLHALHMGYGIGSIVAPQIVTPFLDQRFSGGIVQTGYNSTCRLNDTHTSQPSHITPEYPANFVTTYWILSGISISAALIFVLYHLYGVVCNVRIDEPKSSSEARETTFKESISPTNCSPTHPIYATLIMVSLFAYYVISVPLIRAFSKFIFSYARDGPCLSVTKSTALESAYFIAVTIGRLTAFLSSSVVHMKYLLQVTLSSNIDFIAHYFIVHYFRCQTLKQLLIEMEHSSLFSLSNALKWRLKQNFNLSSCLE